MLAAVIALAVIVLGEAGNEPVRFAVEEAQAAETAARDRYHDAATERFPKA